MWQIGFNYLLVWDWIVCRVTCVYIDYLLACHWLVCRVRWIGVGYLLTWSRLNCKLRQPVWARSPRPGVDRAQTGRSCLCPVSWWLTSWPPKWVSLAGYRRGSPPPHTGSTHSTVSPTWLEISGRGLGMMNEGPVAIIMTLLLSSFWSILQSVTNHQYYSHVTRRAGRMSRAPVSRLGRSGNLNLVGLNTGRVKPITLKLILVTF